MFDWIKWLLFILLASIVLGLLDYGISDLIKNLFGFNTSDTFNQTRDENRGDKQSFDRGFKGKRDQKNYNNNNSGLLVQNNNYGLVIQL